MSPSSRSLLTVLAIIATCTLLAPPAAAINEHATIILHGSWEAWGCWTGIDCETVMPHIDLTGMPGAFVFVLIRNYELVGGLQCAFEVSPSWNFTYTDWDCQSSQLTATTPAPPFGPEAGTIATVFDFLTGGTIEPIGYLHFMLGPAADGCISIVDSAYPGGTSTWHAVGEFTPVAPENRGRACVGPGGYDACESMWTPVSSATWGHIKRQLR